MVAVRRSMSAVVVVVDQALVAVAAAAAAFPSPLSFGSQANPTSSSSLSSTTPRIPCGPHSLYTQYTPPLRLSAFYVYSACPPSAQLPPLDWLFYYLHIPPPPFTSTTTSKMTQSHANFRLGHASTHAKVALTKRDGKFERAKIHSSILHVQARLDVYSSLYVVLYMDIVHSTITKTSFCFQPAPFTRRPLPARLSTSPRATSRLSGTRPA
jgi:hypothetical protein